MVSILFLWYTATRKKAIVVYVFVRTGRASGYDKLEIG